MGIRIGVSAFIASVVLLGLCANIKNVQHEFKPDLSSAKQELASELFAVGEQQQRTAAASNLSSQAMSLPSLMALPSLVPGEVITASDASVDVRNTSVTETSIPRSFHQPLRPGLFAKNATTNITVAVQVDAVESSPTPPPSQASKVQTTAMRRGNRTSCGRLWAVPYYGPFNQVLQHLNMLWLADQLACKPEVVLLPVIPHYSSKTGNGYVMDLSDLYNASWYGQETLAPTLPIGELYAIQRGGRTTRESKMKAISSQSAYVIRLAEKANISLHTMISTSQYDEAHDGILLSEVARLLQPGRELFILNWNFCLVHAFQTTEWCRSMDEMLFGERSPFVPIKEVRLKDGGPPPSFNASMQLRVNDDLWSTAGVMDEVHGSAGSAPRNKNGYGTLLQTPLATANATLRRILQAYASAFGGLLYLTAPPVAGLWEAVDELNGDRGGRRGEGKRIYNISDFDLSSSPSNLIDHELLAGAKHFVYDTVSSYSATALMRRNGTDGAIPMDRFVAENVP